MKEITRYFIITDKGRKAGYAIEDFHREVSRIVCASEYDYFGQVHLYSNDYFKDGCLVGFFVTGKESAVDNFVKYCLERGYLKEDKK